MYIIYCDGEILHHPLMDDQNRIVDDPVLLEAVNAHGSLTFRVAPNHPLYESIRPRRSKITVRNDANGAQSWLGRVVQVDVGWNIVKTVYCEGGLGYLTDIIYPPFGFTGSIRTFLNQLLSTYNNAASTDAYEITLGNLSVTDPNDTIVRSSAYAYSIWKIIEDKLFNSSLGGYIIPRYDARAGSITIDYLSLDDDDEYRHMSSQEVRFGKNILDLSQHIIATNVVTAIMPYGAMLEEGDTGYAPDPPTNGPWNGNRLTIASVNSGSNVLTNDDAEYFWGHVIVSKVWDDVTIASNLKRKAQKWLESQAAQAVTIEVSAIDLSLVDADIEQINVGDFVHVVSEQHGINTLMICSQKETHLTELSQSVIILGEKLKGITDQSLEGGLFA